MYKKNFNVVQLHVQLQMLPNLVKTRNSLRRDQPAITKVTASSWLSALPISELGFALHNGAFRDTLCLRYGWRPSHLPSYCVCGQHFTIEHALSCSRGGFPFIHHNEIRNITADLLSGVCHSVGTEPKPTACN